MKNTAFCSKDKCIRPVSSRGWCNTHYERWRIHGSTDDRVDLHGLSRTPEYDAWRSMLKRCFNPRTKHYEDYGGRGITVWPAWRTSFRTFIEYIGRRPGKGYSLNRINNDGHYEPGNIEWATSLQQGNNKRNNLRATYKGETLTVTEWARKTGLPEGTVRKRIKRGDPIDMPTPRKPPTQCRNGHKYEVGSYWIRKEGTRRCKRCVEDLERRAGLQE